MKKMRHKMALSMLLLIVVNGLFFYTSEAEEVDPVEPNRYKEKKIDIQSNRSRKTDAPKQGLPEEQKRLTFEKVEQTEAELLATKLFQTTFEKENTIKEKSSQLMLFEETEQSISMKDNAQEEEAQTNRLHFIYIALIGVLLLFMLLFIIPRLKQYESK